MQGTAVLNAAIVRTLDQAMQVQHSRCIHVDPAMPGFTSSVAPGLFLMPLTA